MEGPETPAKKEAPELMLSVGVDKQASKAVLDLVVSDPQPVKLRVCFDPSEAVALAKSLAGAALEIQKGVAGNRPLIMIPQRSGGPILPAHRRPRTR